jgi:hypothetical protein
MSGNSLVGVKPSNSRARAHGECSVRDRHKRTSVLLRVRCPPTAFPTAIRLEQRRRHALSRKSSFREGYRIPHPSKRPSCWPRCRTTQSKPTPMSELVIFNRVIELNLRVDFLDAQTAHATNERGCARAQREEPSPDEWLCLRCGPDGLNRSSNTLTIAL